MVKVNRDDTIIVECDCGKTHIFILVEDMRDGAIDCNCGKHIEIHKI